MRASRALTQRNSYRPRPSLAWLLAITWPYEMLSLLVIVSNLAQERSSASQPCPDHSSCSNVCADSSGSTRASGNKGSSSSSMHLQAGQYMQRACEARGLLEDPLHYTLPVQTKGFHSWNLALEPISHQHSGYIEVEWQRQDKHSFRSCRLKNIVYGYCVS